jgi:hypothetical protein
MQDVEDENMWEPLLQNSHLLSNTDEDDMIESQDSEQDEEKTDSQTDEGNSK